MRDCETHAFQQTIEHDQSGTDALFSKFRIRVSSTLTSIRDIGIPFGIQTIEGVTTVERAQDVHTRLWEPRKDFWMLVDGGTSNERTGLGPSIDGVLLISTGITDGAIPIHPLSSQPFGSIGRSVIADTNNGPKPINVSIDEIIGGRTMRISFEIEVCRKLCLGQYDLPPAIFGPITADTRVLNNRWSLSESKDDNWITTRSFTGTLRVSNHAHWPHLMRFLVVPPLLRGYQRIRQSFQDDPTGLVLKYEVEDRQAEAAPPWPAVNWQAHHSETASGPNGSILGGEISIRLTGPPGVDKVQLIASAGKVAADRIRGLAPDFLGGNRVHYGTVLKSASVVNVLNEPTIELRVQATYVPRPDDPDQIKASKSLGIRIKDMGKPLTTLTGTDPYEVEGYDPRAWPVPLLYDSPTPAGTFACYLQSPCSVWHGMPQGLPPGAIPPAPRPPVKPSGYPDQSEISTYPEPLPDDTDTLTPPSPADPKNDIYTFPYTFIDFTQTYRTVTGWTQLPYAYADDDAQKTAALIKLHGKVSKRVLVMEATRQGRMPTVPVLVDDSTDEVNNVREVLESFDFSIKDAKLLAGGLGREYSVRAEYVYLMERGVKYSDKLRGISSQLDKLSPQANWLDLSQNQVAGIQ